MRRIYPTARSHFEARRNDTAHDEYPSPASSSSAPNRESIHRETSLSSTSSKPSASCGGAADGGVPAGAAERLPIGWRRPARGAEDVNGVGAAQRVDAAGAAVGAAAAAVGAASAARVATARTNDDDIVVSGEVQPTNRNRFGRKSFLANEEEGGESSGDRETVRFRRRPRM